MRSCLQLLPPPLPLAPPPCPLDLGGSPLDLGGSPGNPPPKLKGAPSKSTEAAVSRLGAVPMCMHQLAIQPEGMTTCQRSLGQGVVQPTL